VAVSVVAFAITAWGLARIAARATGSPTAAVAAAAVFALNPAVLYLQSTPMTEALLICLLVLAIAFTYDWLEDTTVRNTRRAGCAIAAACLTRYEAWPVTGALLAVAILVLWRRGMTPGKAMRQVWRLAAYPAIGVAAFLLESHLTIGRWFVTGGFFVPDNIDTGNPVHAVASIWWGAHVVGGHAVEWAATAGAIACIAAAWRDRRRSALLAPLALLAVGALPAYAFFNGHPFRIRYMTPLVPALAVFAGLGVGLLRGWPRRAAAVLLIGLALVETPPFDLRSPMVLEAQWDTGNSAARREVTRYLAGHYDGRTIMASMGSLAHYMQELSRAGLALRDFLHEGNGDIWLAALADPRPHVGWILIEEQAAGGDRLARIVRREPRFLDGFERVAEGGGVALYRASGAGREWGR
jgi:4-amino-4-deoxy-L-arabinose transferase-like glycosyltransferase